MLHITIKRHREQSHITPYALTQILECTEDNIFTLIENKGYEFTRGRDFNEIDGMLHMTRRFILMNFLDYKPNNRLLYELLSRMIDIDEKNISTKKPYDFAHEYTPNVEKIYFIQESANKRVKIGRTNQSTIYERLRAFQTGNYRDLSVIYSFHVENDTWEYVIHRKFKHLRIRNDREWFDFTDEIHDFINKLKMGVDYKELLNETLQEIRKKS